MKQSRPAIRQFILLLFLSCLPLFSNADQASADRFFEDALSRFDTGDYEGAGIQLKNALREDPANLPARVLMGRVQLMLGNAASAEKDLKLARSAGADDQLVLVPLGEAYYAQRKYDQILDELHSGGRSADVEAQILTMRGKALLETGKGPEAELAFKQAARLAPTAVSPLFGHAMVLMRNGKLVEGEAMLDKAAMLEPGNAETWFLYGDLARMRQDNETALANYNKALAFDDTYLAARKSRAAVLISLSTDEQARLDVDYLRERDPIDPQVSYLHALLLARAGNYEEAESTLRQLANIMGGLNKEFVDSHGPTLLLYGVIEYMQGHLDRAQLYLDRYVRKFPSHMGARTMLGDVLIQQGDASEALLILSPVLRTRSEDARLYSLLGKAYMMEGDHIAATEMLEKSAQLEPDVADVYTALARTRIAAGHVDEATEDLAQAIRLNSRDERSTTMLAMLQLERGEFEVALKTASHLVHIAPDKGVSYNLLGSAHQGLQQWREAREAFTRALEIDPSYRPASLNLAGIDMKEGKFRDAAQEYQSLLQEDAREIQAMIGMSRVAEAEGRPRDSIQWLEKVRNVNPDAQYELLRLAELYLQVGEAENAREIALTLEKRSPTNLKALDLLGRAYLLNGNLQQASDVFRSMYGFARESIAWLHKIALHQIQARDFENAAELLQDVLGRRPDFLPARVAQVRLYIETGQLKDALKLATEIERKNPDMPGGDLLVGDVMMKQGRFDDAVDAYSKGLRKSASSALTMRKYMALLANGRNAQAWRVLDDWLKSHPDDRRVRRALASNHMQAGRVVEAIEHFEYLLIVSRDRAVIKNNLANLYQRANRDAEALEMAKSAYKLNPRLFAISDTLGWILVQHGQVEQGLKYLREAESRASRSPDIQYHIGVALHKLGRDKDARQALNEALDAGIEFEGKTDALMLMRDLYSR